MQVSRDRIIKARKDHKCYWCGNKIKKGKTYHRWACFTDGTAFAIKVHLECKDAWDVGMKEEPSYYGEEVVEADHQQGCLCSRWADGCEGCKATY